ncbi:putative RNA-directed DNA polymerase [Aphis craccivora]|uniref:Putative RNA-directed DNA polymerase n=1 Tax=Aphis craccivora TaxID=307492 RepID=A0A6G0ZRD2_APHCR|nr:putative RNA-directed DNA polymerase [Aphis craccivora]
MIFTQKYGKYNYVGRVNCHMSVYQNFNGQLYVHHWTIHPMLEHLKRLPISLQQKILLLPAMSMTRKSYQYIASVFQNITLNKIINASPFAFNLIYITLHNYLGIISIAETESTLFYKRVFSDLEKSIENPDTQIHVDTTGMHDSLLVTYRHSN